MDNPSSSTAEFGHRGDAVVWTVGTTVKDQARAGWGIFDDDIWAVLLSCFVFWCCCCPLGFAGLIMALSSEDQATEGQMRTGLKISYILSLIGLAIGLVIFGPAIIVCIYIYGW